MSTDLLKKATRRALNSEPKMVNDIGPAPLQHRRCADQVWLEGLAKPSRISTISHPTTIMLIEAPPPTLTLRPYQVASVDSVIDAWESDPRVCLALPTGAGKTVVAAGLIQKAQADGMRVAFITDRLTLIPQTIRMFETAGLRCAVVQGDRTSSAADQAAADVLICSAQTLEARSLFPADLDVGVAIVDECHIERAIVRRWLEMSLCTCGLTATPLARWMPEAWKQLISPVTTREAIDDAWLLEPIFRAEILDVEKDTTEYLGSPMGPGGDWSDDQAAQIMEPHLDAVVAAWQRVVALPVAEGGFHGVAPQTIVQAATVDHAEALAQRFSDQPHEWSSMGEPSAIGKHRAESDRIRGSFDLVHLRGLVSVAKLMVGFDAPEAACFVSARPTRRLLAVDPVDWAHHAHRFTDSHGGRLHGQRRPVRRAPASVLGPRRRLAPAGIDPRESGAADTR